MITVRMFLHTPFRIATVVLKGSMSGNWTGDHDEDSSMTERYVGFWQRELSCPVMRIGFVRGDGGEGI